ncbi:MAG: flagellar hook assembly protein FlgD [Rhizobiaceae bacterium]|nr:flagellar hook assembly protein FlgD [Rhizobiaceae bacterium]MCV0407000.1 flagellar hook assembly protein FlgD [Rhizobiaceae bacterium]
MMVDGVSTATASGGTNGSSSSPAKATADYETFLKLLVAEMKNQDPTNPMDSTEYVSQLASFSSVEQSVQLNKKLEMILESNSLAQADAILGRHVTSQDGTKSGIVAQVIIASDGVVAVTEDGTKIPVYPGTVISATPPQAPEEPSEQAA